MSYVRIENLVKEYGDLTVLKNVSLSINEGEFVSFLGPSGCGKSTLLRAIAGLNDISNGNVFVGDKDITYLSPRNREVGLVFQSYALFPNMNVFNNIAFGLKMESMKKEAYTPIVSEMIELIDLKGMEKRFPHQLSGGQQQRVALGRALVKRPKVLLLDEPLSALDAKIRRTLRSEIRRIQQQLNMTTIFVTHVQEEALTISDRLFVMNQGTIEQVGTPSEIYKTPNTEYVARFIGNYNVLNKKDLLHSGMKNVPDKELIAIRPEAITIKSIADAQEFDIRGKMVGNGTIKNVHILGNVIRFEISLQELVIQVDVLHDDSISQLKEQSNVMISVPLSECKPLLK